MEKLVFMFAVSAAFLLWIPLTESEKKIDMGYFDLQNMSMAGKKTYSDQICYLNRTNATFNQLLIKAEEFNATYFHFVGNFSKSDKIPGRFPEILGELEESIINATVRVNHLEFMENQIEERLRKATDAAANLENDINDNTAILPNINKTLLTIPNFDLSQETFTIDGKDYQVSQWENKNYSYAKVVTETEQILELISTTFQQLTHLEAKLKQIEDDSRKVVDNESKITKATDMLDQFNSTILKKAGCYENVNLTKGEPQRIFPRDINGERIIEFGVRIICDNDWIIIQKRIDGVQSFNRSCEDYMKGFGDKWGEYWIGLDNLHNVTSSGDYELRIDATDENGQTMHVTYESFEVNLKYQARVGKVVSGSEKYTLQEHSSDTEWYTFTLGEWVPPLVNVFTDPYPTTDYGYGNDTLYTTQGNTYHTDPTISDVTTKSKAITRSTEKYSTLEATNHTNDIVSTTDKMVTPTAGTVTPTIPCLKGINGWWVNGTCDTFQFPLNVDYNGTVLSLGKNSYKNVEMKIRLKQQPF